MKNPIHLLAVLLIAITQFSCNDHEDFKAGNGSATFSMSPLARGKNGGRSEQTETPAAVLLSIEDSNGNVVVQNKKLSLFSFGQGYVSESLELSVGSYKLTQFLVLNANDTIIYAAPMAGSALAQYVTNPLPISFNISKDASTQVVPQVLAVSHTDTPESFGYVSFGFEVVSISVITNSTLKVDLKGNTQCDSVYVKITQNDTITYPPFELLAEELKVSLVGLKKGAAEIQLILFEQGNTVVGNLSRQNANRTTLQLNLVDKDYLVNGPTSTSMSFDVITTWKDVIRFSLPNESSGFSFAVSKDGRDNFFMCSSGNSNINYFTMHRDYYNLDSNGFYNPIIAKSWFVELSKESHCINIRQILAQEEFETLCCDKPVIETSIVENLFCQPKDWNVMHQFITINNDLLGETIIDFYEIQ